MRTSATGQIRGDGCLVDLLECGAWLLYLSRGESRLAEESRALVLRLKQEGDTEGGGEGLARQIIHEHAEELRARFGDFFGQNVTLVPVPRSRQVTVREAWPSSGIALGLIERRRWNRGSGIAG